MKNTTFKTALLCVLFMPFLMLSCTDQMEEHYEVGQWLKGTAWKTLEDRGNFSMFLQAAELTGFRPILEGKSIVTVMAPDDAAFAAYLRKHNYSDIGSINRDTLQAVIGFHLLYYSYNKEKLVNFRPEGDLTTDEEKVKNAGIYYKFRTRSSNVPTTETEASSGAIRMIYHSDRFLPVFSFNYFTTNQLDAARNYEYFYPNSTWQGGSDGFNVSNAAVTEYEIAADNGYIYTVDQVIEPLETIYTELKKNTNFSIFFNLYNKNSYYLYDKTLSEDYAAALGTDSLFLHAHTDLPSIAQEWASPLYQNVATNSSVGYSIFALSNAAMNNFFADYWERGGYESLDDVDELAMDYLLAQFVFAGGLAFPQDITSGKVKNRYEMRFNFNPATVPVRQMCVNGVLYGLNATDTPVLFGSVVGPAFRNKDSNYYLYMLSGAGLISAYASQETKYVMLVPTNTQLESQGIMLNTYEDGTRLEQQTEDGLVPLPSSMMVDIVNMHTATGVEGLNQTGAQVVATQVGFNYWYVKDGKLTSSAAYNQILEPDNVTDPFIQLTEIKNGSQNWNNGKAYSYDSSVLFQSESSDGLQHRLGICNDARYVYYQFAQLMQSAGMVGSVSSGYYIRDLIGTAHFIGFIPTNVAISAAIAAGQIPGVGTNGIVTDAALLRQYLLSYFVRDTEQAITTYPYPGSTIRSGVRFRTASGREMTYTDTGSSLSIAIDGNTANVVSTYNFFPFAFRDGCFQLIDTVL